MSASLLLSPNLSNFSTAGPAENRSTQLALGSKGPSSKDTLPSHSPISVLFSALHALAPPEGTPRPVPSGSRPWFAGLLRPQRGSRASFRSAWLHGLFPERVLHGLFPERVAPRPLSGARAPRPLSGARGSTASFRSAWPRLAQGRLLTRFGLHSSPQAW